MKKLLFIFAGLLVGLAALVVAGGIVFNQVFGPELQQAAEDFQFKARQSEAKSNLSAIYLHMKMQQAEFNIFGSTDLNELIQSKAGQNHKYKYLIGFTQPFSSGSSEFSNNNPDRRWLGNTDPEFIAMAKKVCPDCSVSETSFKAIALTKLEDGTWDAWVVSSDNNKPQPLTIE